jgi:alpha-amylase
LFNLHSTHPALDARVPVQRIETSDDSKVFAYHRKKDSKEVLVLLNLSPSSVKINLRNNEFTGAYRNVFNNQQMNINSSSEFEINKWEYLVLENKTRTRLSR